jgi:alanine dehydrogenase
MRIGVPREIKPGELRAGLTPQAVRSLCALGHEVRVESGAGAGIGHSDAHFEDAGARLGSFADAWGSTLVVKVKEFQPGEAARISRGTTVFSFQHLAGEPALTREVAARGANAIAYELVRDERGQFPLLAPMSVIAGRMAIQVGAHLLGQDQGGNGTLLAGVPGAEPARVLVLGAGHAGSNAAELAAAMGAEVTLLTRSPATRDAMRERFGHRLTVEIATPSCVEAGALAADLVVGAVFVPGRPTPKLLARSLVARMKRGAVIVDVCIDAGGVAETSRPTTQAAPTFIDEGVVHYCVPNMPAAVARSSTRALVAATLPYVIEMAAKGVARAVRENAALRAGVLIWEGVPTHPAIAADAGLPCRALESLAA